VVTSSHLKLTELLAEALEELVSSEGKVVNPWYIPHYKEALVMLQGEALITQIRGLSGCLKILSLFQVSDEFSAKFTKHNIQDMLEILKTQDPFSGPPGQGLNLLSTQNLALELNTIHNEMISINRGRYPIDGSPLFAEKFFSMEELVSFLMKKRQMFYLRFILLMVNLRDALLAEDKYPSNHN
jgi:hypothetical protein